MAPFEAKIGGVIGAKIDKGNQTCRLRDGTAYLQTFDAENRLASVTKNGSVVATFTYDGDGNRVKKMEGSVTTVYVGGHYEKNISTGVVTKYYYAGSQRIAQRKGSVVYYLHADHLGSTSLATCGSGSTCGGNGAATPNSRTWYKPYGELRAGGSTLPTDRRYTGQRWEAGLGLYDYGARYYDPLLGRFVSADTVVPGTTCPERLIPISA